MPLFYFDFADGHSDADVEGSELASLDEARDQAILLGAGYLRDNPVDLLATGEWRVEVRDVDRRLLLTVKVSLDYAAAP